MKCVLIFAVAVLGLGAAPANATSPSYWCSFTEPFVSLFTGASSTVFSNSGAVERVAKPQFSPAPGGGILSGTLKDGGTYKIKVSAGKGSDGMSDFDYPLTGVLTGAFNATGGCLKLPPGTALRQIVGVAPDDNLVLRVGPSAKARAIDKIKLDYVWAIPGPARNGWQRVVVLVWPKGEQGMISTRTGWVNRKFLSAKVWR
ncbi:MAG: hypothetical protein KGO94_05715 [Alphaproteobacteria bacterium]|nr:hypothetical protein [Alphaproteobacteria bacterium]